MDQAAPSAPALGCVFARALLARAAACELSRRRSIGERESMRCLSPVAHTNCETLAALMRERARFALRLPRPDEPLMHAQAMRLQCGGLGALRQALGDEAVDAHAGPAEAVPGEAPRCAEPPDVHALVAAAMARHGSLTALPWDAIVASMRAWAPRRRRPPA